MNGGRFNWVDGDAWLIIAARAVRGSAQSAVSVLVAILLALQGFSLVETGLLLTCGSIGASASAVVVGLFGDAFGRRRALLILAGSMTLTGIAFAATDNFVILITAAFVGSLSALAGSGGGMGTIEQAILAVCVSPARRTDVFALYGVVGMLAAALGALAAGLATVLQGEGGIAPLPSLRVMFLGYAALVSGVLIGMSEGLQSGKAAPSPAASGPAAAPPAAKRTAPRRR